VPPDHGDAAYWRRLLLEEKPATLRGSVIFPCSDEAVEFLSAHRDALAAHYTLDHADPGISLAMLDKQQTLELAAKAGCPAPSFHRVDVIGDITDIKEGLDYPVMIKPVHSHLFQKHYPNKKYLVADDPRELYDKVKDMLDKELRLIISEIIPGPDDLQSAFYAYITRDGAELFSYTHQIVRRYPKNCGLACMTVTRALPDTAEMGRRFFRGIGLTGMAHVEFKLDTRDGRLKLIECNPRMSAAQAVVTGSGLDMAWRIYEHLLHGVVYPDSSYRLGVRRWWVYLDIRAYFELRRLGEINFADWVRSIKGPPLVFPYFCLDDPRPALIKSRQNLSSTFLTGVNLVCQSVKGSLISYSRVLSRRCWLK
jgi:predicted ATP-grasp superfamily ATP-dependent carboligase